MHTRSAPVRHSHPPEGGIPSDLHVLGLPPAFILSQDQTLRCNIVFASCFSVSRVRLLFVDGDALQRRRSLPAPHPFSDGPAPLPGGSRPAVLASDCQRTSANLPTVSCPSTVVCGCKSTTFCVTRNLFRKLFSIISHISLIDKKKNFHPNAKQATEHGQNHRENARHPAKNGNDNHTKTASRHRHAAQTTTNGPAKGRNLPQQTASTTHSAQPEPTQSNQTLPSKTRHPLLTDTHLINI